MTNQSCPSSATARKKESASTRKVSKKVVRHRVVSVLTDYFQTQFVASETPERMALRIADAFEGSTLNFPDSADLDRAEMRAVTDEELTTDPSPENITRIARRFSVARVVITKSFARRGGGVEERRCELALA